MVLETQKQTKKHSKTKKKHKAMDSLWRVISSIANITKNQVKQLQIYDIGEVIYERFYI